MTAYKFTDRDVREDGYLTSIAYSFLSFYQGDFEFLRDAKEAMQHGNLSVGTIRGVLNCMRTDPFWSTKLVTPQRTPYAAPATRPTLRVVERARPAYMKLRARFKVPYIMSTWPTARVCHMLDLDRTTLWWYPHISEYNWQPYSYCGDIHSCQNHLGTSFDVPEGRRLCLRCIRVRETRR